MAVIVPLFWPDNKVQPRHLPYVEDSLQLQSFMMLYHMFFFATVRIVVILLPTQRPVHLIEFLDVVLVSTCHAQLHVEVTSDVKNSSEPPLRPSRRT